MSKSTQNKDKKRLDLLKSAYKLFTTIGFKKTTILAIALNAGIGKGTFYLYFKDKEEVRDALIIQKSSELLLSASQHYKKVYSDKEDAEDLSEKIIFVIDDILTMLSKDIALLQFVSKNLSWGLFFDSNRYNKSGEDVLDFKKFIIEELIERSDKKIDHPDLLIYTIIELVNSTCYNVILNGEPTSFSEFKPYLYKNIRLLVNNSVVDG